MRLNGEVWNVETKADGDQFVTVRLDGGDGRPMKGTAVVVLSGEAEEQHARVVHRARVALIQRTAATDFRGAYSRCSFCSWTWDDGAPEKHAGACVLAPFGLAPGHTYAPVDGEPVAESST